MQRILLLALFLLTQLALSFAQPKSIYYSHPNEDNYPSFLLKDKQGSYIISGEAKEHGSNFQFETGGTYPAFYAKLDRNGQVLGDIPKTYAAVNALHPLSNNTYLSFGKYGASGSCNGVKYSYSSSGPIWVDSWNAWSVKNVNANLWKSFKNVIDDSVKHKLVNIEAINDSCALAFTSSYIGNDKKIHCLFDASMREIVITWNGGPSPTADLVSPIVKTIRTITYDSLGKTTENKEFLSNFKPLLLERGSNNNNSLLLSISEKDSSVIANYTDQLYLNKVITPKVSNHYYYPGAYIRVKKLKDKNYLLTSYFPEKEKTELILFGEDLQIKKKTMLDFEVVDIHQYLRQRRSI
jgi:hypothetical protein